MHGRRRPQSLSSRMTVHFVVIASLSLVATGALGEERATPPRQPTPLASDAGWSARLPKAEKVQVRGAVNFDDAGSGSRAMMYPAPGVVGLFAAVLTHAVIVNSVRGSEKSRIQVEADKVLVPYEETLSAWSTRDLVRQALEKSTAGGSRAMIEASTAESGWVVESAPVFVLTQDQRALILENSIAVFAPGAAAAPVYQNLVRVVSAPQAGEEVAAEWNAEQGKRFKDVGADLLGRSYDLALQDMGRAAVADVPHRTYRFAEGGTERMERAQLVESRCEATVVRTLRGSLLAFPAKSEVGTASGGECQRSASVTR